MSTPSEFPVTPIPSNITFVQTAEAGPLDPPEERMMHFKSVSTEDMRERYKLEDNWFGLGIHLVVNGIVVKRTIGEAMVAPREIPVCTVYRELNLTEDGYVHIGEVSALLDLLQFNVVSMLNSFYVATDFPQNPELREALFLTLNSLRAQLSEARKGKDYHLVQKIQNVLDAHMGQYVPQQS